MITKKGKVWLFYTTFLVLGLFGATYYFFLKPDPPLENKFVIEEAIIRNSESPFGPLVGADVTSDQTVETPAIQPRSLATPPTAYQLPQANHTYQTFNNCGPATLSMFLSYFDINVDQKTLGEQMRPYQHPKGDNDDKTIFPAEFTDWAEEYGENIGLNVIYRPNGSIELLKYYLSNDIPVVAKTWLNLKEDIGHFIIVRGYDDNKQIVIVDDSYYGPNRKYSYYDFLSLWQSFNFSYIVAYDGSQIDIVEDILGNEIVEKVAWQNAVTRAHKEHDLVPDNIYPLYNLAVGYYHIGDYEESIKYFEQVEDRLPRRMLWYQIEPIKSYIELGDYDRAFELIENILENGNKAFSELYYIRGQIYLERGEKDKAKNEFEQAVFYNSGYVEAQNALENL